MKDKLWLAAIGIAAIIVILGTAGLLLIIAPAQAADVAGQGAGGVSQWAFAAGAAAAGLSALAAGYAVAHVGSAGVGALAEKPELFGRILILVGLAEGIAIYGLIVAILIFNRIG